ncbi:MAG TPA: glycosyltransferase family 39 protein [Ignavibacteriaceae bacterium]|nr:glycosyltransferase family 39 protein [Ignavibacteriaceae bacterium]
MKKSLNDFFAANKFLLLLGFINFLIIYLSSFNKAYEYFIDEFYYIACANNPAAGYVDHPPLAPLILTVYKAIFGTSIYAIRFLPALASAVTVFLGGILTRKIGGYLFAQVFSSITIMCFPVLAAMSGFYSMNAFEPLLALIAIILIVDIINNYDIKKWLYIGFVFGLGMNNKHTFVIIIAFILLSLIISGKWKLLWNKYFFIGLFISLILIVPNII